MHLLTPTIVLILSAMDFADTIGFWGICLLDNSFSLYMYLLVTCNYRLFIEIF